MPTPRPTPVEAVALGSPFAALTTGRTTGDGWQPAAALYADPGPLVAQVDAALGGVEERVAASTVGLGWAGRLWSLGLGVLAGWGVVPVLADLLWRQDAGRVRLHLVEGRTRAGGVGELHAEIVDGHLRLLFAGLGEQVAEGLLWGNAASSLVAAGRLVPAALGTAGEATVRERAASAVAGLLAREPLAGRLDPDGRRRSCCLFYRVPGGGLCDDCSLDEVPLRA